MIPATQDQIEAACMTRSATDAVTYLRSQGVMAHHRQCDDVIAALIEEGRRGRLGGGGQGVPDTSLTYAVAKAGCDRLLRTHLQTGRHWISDPARMADALRQAGMVRDPIAA